MTAPTATQDRIEKLPKWAQDEISRLRRDLEYVQTALHHATGEAPEDSRLILHPYSDLKRIPIEDSTVLHAQFAPGHEQFLQVRIEDDRRHGPGLLIHSGRGLSVRPRSSNVVFVAVDGDL